MRFAILLVWTLFALRAQKIEVRSFSQVAPLDGDWRISTGDDPRFAAADFDDSGWRVVRVPDFDLALESQWTRFRVQLAEPLPAEPLLMLLPPLSGAYEVFINGRPVGSFGNPRAAHGWGGQIPASAVFGIPRGTHQFTVAIRTGSSAFLRALRPEPRAARGAWLGTAAGVAGKQRQMELERRWTSVIHIILIAAIATAGLFFLLLPIWNRDARGYFWCGLFLTSFTVMRPMITAPWVLEAWPGPVLAAVFAAFSALNVHAWERLFHHLLDVRLSGWVLLFWRSCLVSVVSFGAASLFWLDSVVVMAPLVTLLTAIASGVVYVTMTRRSVANELMGWMNVAVAVFLIGSGSYFFFRSPFFVRFLPGNQAAELAATVRGIGTLLFAGVMAMLLNRRSARMQSEQSRLAQEMRAGAEIQELLLPAEPVNAPGFRTEAAYLSMSEVGGDFYWFRAEPNGSLIVVVGDVSGKGLKAAMLVSVTIGLLRNERSPSPASILTALNRGLAGQTRGGFVTACCARFDPDGTVVLANAGHLPPYSDGEEIASAGLPLGLGESAEYDETALRATALTFVSDGVVEAENAQRELFGFDRTREISTKSAQEIAEAAKAWGQNDDITVVTVQKIASSEARRNA